MTLDFNNPEAILEQALNNHKYEADLRPPHHIALKQLQTPDASQHRNFATWKEQERRLWLLVNELNGRISWRRWDIVDIDEEIDFIERRFERVYNAAVMPQTPHG